MRALIALSLLLTASASAQDETPQREVRYEAVQQVDFTEVDVRAVLQRPQVRLTLEVQHHAFPSLVELRSDFREEMKTSVQEIQ